MKSHKNALFLFFAVFLSVLNSNAQVGIVATGGVGSAPYTTLKGAFDAINAGTHTEP